MKRKVSELEGALLDAAVAKALGWLVERTPEDFMDLSVLDRERMVGYVLDDEEVDIGWSPSRRWQDGGPIIDLDHIELLYYGAKGIGGNPWEAQLGVDTHYIDQYPGDAMGGPTPLIAAMRAYVASKFGDTVELP